MHLEEMDSDMVATARLDMERSALEMPQGVDALILVALTDGTQAWYGIEIDKKRYRVTLEDETEDSVYLKIVKQIPPGLTYWQHLKQEKT